MYCLHLLRSSPSSDHNENNLSPDLSTSPPSTPPYLPYFAGDDMSLYSMSVIFAKGDSDNGEQRGNMSDSDITASVTPNVFRVLLVFKKLNESTIKQMQFLQSRFLQLYGQPKNHKPHLINI